MSSVAKSILCIFVLLAATGTAFAGGYEIKKRVGGYEVEIKLDRWPPVVGDNRIEVGIKDTQGKPVTDAEVLVNYYMPPMPRMAPMNYTTKAPVKGDSYRATMKFIMSGPWTIAVKMRLQGKRITIKLNVDAQ